MPATAFSVNGVVELLPLDDDTLISMERSFSVGAPDTGNTIKLFKVELRGHTARKTLLLDLDDLGIPLDNVEGMSSGPPAPRPSLAGSGQRQQLRPVAVHTVLVVRYARPSHGPMVKPGGADDRLGVLPRGGGVDLGPDPAHRRSCRSPAASCGPVDLGECVQGLVVRPAPS